MANSNSLRIIGGEWRSRRIQFINSPKIRPTPDRVRETLFNWLAANINGATCLDLFAGSGALGFEAMSRGADQVVLVEIDSKIAENLIEQKAHFKVEHMQVSNQNALAFLVATKQQFDLIFLDPPFDSDLLEQAVALILEQHLLTVNGLIYVESASQQTALKSLEELDCIREKVSGDVRYALYKKPA